MRQLAVLAASDGKNSARTASISGKAKSTAQCGLALGKKCRCSNSLTNFINACCCFILKGLVAQLGLPFGQAFLLVKKGWGK